jgi:hypothetical protein
VAKRFTDSGKWDKEWFRRLSPRLKCAWDFLCTKCDHAGVWDVDMDTLTHFVGERVTADELLDVFGDKIVYVDGSTKIYIPSFVEFQYRSLKSSNRVHQSVLNRLEELKIKPLMQVAEAPYRNAQGAQDTDTDKDTDTESDKEADTEKRPKTFAIEPDQISKCWEVWRETLKTFGKERNRTQSDEQAIAKAIRRWGHEDVALALLGARFEPGSEKFKPKDHVALYRIFERVKGEPCKFEKFLGWGAESRMKAATKKEAEQRREIPREEESTDPARVREIIASAFRAKGVASA